MISVDLTWFNQPCLELVYEFEDLIPVKPPQSASWGWKQETVEGFEVQYGLTLFIYIYIHLNIHVHFADPKNQRLMGSRQLFACTVVVKPHVLLRIQLVLTSRPCKGVNHHHWICVQEIRNFYTIPKSRTFLPGAIPEMVEHTFKEPTWSIDFGAEVAFGNRAWRWNNLHFYYTVRWFWIWECFSKLNRVPLKFDVYQHVSC